MNQLPKILFLLVVFIFSSCSSTRVLEKPNFELTGESKKDEYEKFKLGSIYKYGGSFSSEGLFASAKRKQLEPFMNEISPKSVEMWKKNDFKEDLSWVVFIAWAGTLLLSKDGEIPPAYWYGAGAAVGYGIYLTELRNDVIDQYNKDLKQKFAPALGYSFQF